MDPPNYNLKQLRGFNRASPQFHKHLSNLLRSEGYRSTVPSLQGEDLAWLVEYLDNVSLQTISPESAPNFITVLGSYVYFRSREPRISGILARTEKYLRCQKSLAEITYTFEPPPGHQPPVCFWIRGRGDFEGTDSTCKNAPQRRPADIRNGAFFTTLSLIFGC